MTDRKAALAGQLARLAPQEQAATAAPMPAEQDKPDRWPARISMTASPEMKRALDLARLDDGIEFRRRELILRVALSRVHSHSLPPLRRRSVLFRRSGEVGRPCGG